MRSKKQFIWASIAILLVASIVLAACAKTAEAPAAEEPAGETVAALPQGQELANAYAGQYKGKVVTMAGPFTDQDEVVFNDSIKAFEEKTGIDIQYEGSKEFEANINIRLDGGDRPDIVDYPQPGLLKYAVEKGYAIDMNTLINPDWIKTNYSDAWQALAKMTGPNGEIAAGIWARANGKSFVFYPKKAFDEAGYKVPETWDEMMALTQQIADDGDT
ncbi:MAG TPA: ABC transporter substrate-binding protein, partial [Anaerolineaceae bacterium]|nr:ABC transporter substrate-binding protein [Anaerolineaceae bacterium]